MENYTAFIGIASTIVGGGIGYFLKFYLDKKKELVSEITKERRAMYQQFVDLIINIFVGSKFNRNSTDKHVEDLYKIFKKNIMYASPGVIRALSDFFQYLYASEGQKGNPKAIFRHVTSTIKEMRKDLGLSNKGLGIDGEELLRPLIKDWDQLK